MPCIPDDPKRRRNEELKRKALLIARKEESRKGGGSSKMSSSNGLSQFEAETLSNAGMSETGSEMTSKYSVASSDVMPFITGTKLPRKPIHSTSVSNLSQEMGLVPLTESALKALDSEFRKRPRQF